MALSSQLDGELALCLRHLSKRDPTTKLKALQSLRSQLPNKPTAAVVAVLPAWAHLFARLAMDNNRAVRAESARVLGQVVGLAGKAVAPHLKGLMGSWWMAQFDPNQDAAAAARSAFQASFPGRKQLDVLLFTRQDLLAVLATNLTATATQLGDARKDTPDELQERQERVQAASLTALAQLMDLLAPALRPSLPASPASPSLPSSSPSPSPSLPPSQPSPLLPPPTLLAQCPAPPTLHRSRGSSRAAGAGAGAGAAAARRLR
ncbi:hypothetical protein QJQ45_023216, partial [Haematococcus lacustris]